jgi:hypothetical protein
VARKRRALCTINGQQDIPRSSPMAQAAHCPDGQPPGASAVDIYAQHACHGRVHPVWPVSGVAVSTAPNRDVPEHRHRRLGGGS